MGRVHIDGFNLYFGLKSKNWRKYYWLDLVAVSQALVKPGQELVHCHYFTARVSAGGVSQSARRQALWLETPATRARLTTHFGHYLPKRMECFRCGATWMSHEEIMSAASVDPVFIASIRKKLNLDQREAAELFGGGVNAFSRYENGRTKPPLALIQLLRLLDRHPDLLNEVRSA
jgi:DNA-binding transcriptional regulator YiaG